MAKQKAQPKNKIPDLVFAASRVAGEVLVQFINNDEKLQKKIEGMIGGARRASKSQLWTDAKNAARLIQNLEGMLNFIVTDEAAATMGGFNSAASTASSPPTPYAILGVTENAPIEVVEAAFKALAKKYHPDIPHTGDVEKMKAINVAYEAIRNRRSS